MKDPITIKDKYLYWKTYFSLFFTSITTKPMKSRVEFFSSCLSLLFFIIVLHWLVSMYLKMNRIEKALELIN